MVARMNRLSTPVVLATSRMDSWIAEVSSGLLRATSQASQDSSIWFWLTENLPLVSFLFALLDGLYLQVFEG